jgi:hypothetical protein
VWALVQAGADAAERVLAQDGAEGPAAPGPDSGPDPGAGPDPGPDPGA